MDTIFQKIRNNEYENSRKMPKKGDFKIICQNCTCGKHDIDMKRYDEEKLKYHLEKKEKNNKFKKDLLEHVGLTDHKKGEDIFYYALENAGTYGLEAVVYCMEELSDLLT